MSATNGHYEGARNAERIIPPRADIAEDKEGVTLHVDLPGVSEDSLEVTVERGVLTISGRRTLAQPEGLELRHREFADGTLRRTFTLSDDLDGEKIEATLNQGVLRVRIPKSERVKPRKIQIRTAQ